MAKSEESFAERAAEKAKSVKRKIVMLVPILSLLIILGIFWWLKLTGITMAGDAFCGMAEHTHVDGCMTTELICGKDVTEEDLPESEQGSVTETSAATESETATNVDDGGSDKEELHKHTDDCYKVVYVCNTEEHIHVESCYSDINADKETAKDWEATMSHIPNTATVSEKIYAIAESQLGYTESTLNFTVDSSGVRRGYTRYGEWYGNPYGDWSTMFTSFCLRYAGAEDVPINAGAEAMRVEWNKAERYKTAGNSVPVKGDVVFLDKNKNGTADATAIVGTLSDGVLYTIEGDVENAVHETAYMLSDAAVMGFGTSVTGSKPVAMMATSPAADDSFATTVTYNANMFSTDGDLFVIYMKSGTNYYAVDGNGNAVQIYIDGSGKVTANVSDPSILLWSFTKPTSGNGKYQQPNNNYTNEDAYFIQNVSTGKYIHPCNEGSSVISGKWESGLFPNSGGVRIRGARQNYYSYLSGSTFKDTNTANNGAVFFFAKSAPKITIWLDGTNGGLMGLGNAGQSSISVDSGGTVVLPETWASPAKYSYTLHGWFDIINNKYYKPGDSIENVTSSTVLYADWWASTYDIGKFNEYVSDTVSTNAFIKTNVFDYNSLFNLHSLNGTISATAGGHSETWNMVSGGKVNYNNSETLNFIFCDYDAGGDISYANGRGDNNVNRSVVTSGIYNDKLGNILFATDNSYDPETGQGIIGKKYLGVADNLFHFDSDPNSDTRGYYYYDSKLNAASYNQSDETFYVYDYLERTSDSKKDGGAGEYSDFLPFNSPYENTNAHNQATYTYNGENSEFVGTTHYQYDAKYDGQESVAANIGTNYWFGMSIDIRFYLSNVPGETDSDGHYGNLDLYGNEMHFKFSGDDDLWVLVDGELVLDVGGIHGIKNGDINFSTGEVTVEGELTGLLQNMGIGTGEHILTVYYLERGSSQSNCAIYFNIAPRFKFTIQKEDVLTRDLLNGAEFTIYEDKALTQPAKLWYSESDYHNSAEPVNVFTVKNGSTSFWGLCPGKTYYIVETKPPTETDYSIAHGIICLSLDYKGKTTYTVEIVDEVDENGNPVEVSKGYTVHGFRIDEETQEAFIVITNAYSWVTDTTTVQVAKKWSDSLDHSADSVTVYMTVTYEDGSVKRIREIVLNEEVGWSYTWTNLPKYWVDGVTEVVYGVEEAYKEGYYGHIELIDHDAAEQREWVEAYSFVDEEVYILGTNDGYLATRTDNSGNPRLYLIADRQTAKTTPAAQWTASMINGRYSLTNGDGWTLNYHHGANSNGRWINVANGTDEFPYENVYLSFVETTGGIEIYFPTDTGDYYFASYNSTYGRFSVTTAETGALVFVPRTPGHTIDVPFEITNIPIDDATSLRVNKVWDDKNSEDANFEKFQVTVRLMANGTDTGRNVTLNLRNGWSAVFEGLPYTDQNGDVINYTVVETNTPENWIPTYGELVESGTNPPTYSLTVTNTYNDGYTVELPATGGFGKTPWILGGYAIMATAIVFGYVLRRKRERRSN